MKQEAQYLKVKLVLGCVSLTMGFLAANLALFNWVERAGLYYLFGVYARYVCAYGGFGAMIFGAMLINDFLIFRNLLKRKHVRKHKITIFADANKGEEKQTVVKKEKAKKVKRTIASLVVLFFIMSPLAKSSLVSYTATVTITPQQSSFVYYRSDNEPKLLSSCKGRMWDYSSWAFENQMCYAEIVLQLVKWLSNPLLNFSCPL